MNNKRRETKKADTVNPAVDLGKSLLLAYLLTGLLLLLAALLLYKLELSAKTAAFFVVFIYVASAFCGGFVMGKCRGNKKYLWGLLTGSVYFLLLLGVSLWVSHSAGTVTEDVWTTFLICAGGGMIGGMAG